MKIVRAGAEQRAPKRVYAPSTGPDQAMRQNAGIKAPLRAPSLRRSPPGDVERDALHTGAAVAEVQPQESGSPPCRPQASHRSAVQNNGASKQSRRRLERCAAHRGDRAGGLTDQNECSRSCGQHRRFSGFLCRRARSRSMKFALSPDFLPRARSSALVAAGSGGSSHMIWCISR